MKINLYSLGQIKVNRLHHQPTYTTSMLKTSPSQKREVTDEDVNLYQEIKTGIHK
jgi:hypothetical protein